MSLPANGTGYEAWSVMQLSLRQPASPAPHTKDQETVTFGYHAQRGGQVADGSLVTWVSDRFEEEELPAPTATTLHEKVAPLPAELEHLAACTDRVGGGSLVNCGRVVFAASHGAQDLHSSHPDVTVDAGRKSGTWLAAPRAGHVVSSGRHDPGEVSYLASGPGH